MLFRILHTLSILTGPDIFLNICLSEMRRMFSSFAVTVPVSDQCVTTGLIIVLYVFILVFFFRSFDFIRFELAQYVLLPFAIFFQQFLYSFYYLHSKWNPNNQNFDLGITKIKNTVTCSRHTINELDPRQYIQGIQNSPAGCPVNP